MGKQYKSVSDLAKDLSTDEEFQAELEKEISDKALAKALFTMRCSKQITQNEMAERIGCKQGKISKLENSSAESIKVGDLLAYAKALDLQLNIGFHPKLTAAECVNFYRNQMMRHLDHLVGLVKGDRDIGEGVADVFREQFKSILNFFKDKAGDLPVSSVQSVLEVTAPSEFENQEDRLLYNIE